MNDQSVHGPNAVVRSSGVTRAERYLKRLCDKTFLSLWSYPELYRDQGSWTGKEVCDLLVVFGEHVIIFSDKDVRFPDTGNLAKDWGRWFRKALSASAQQILGAERWIRTFPLRLFLDRGCTRRFPISLPSATQMRVHRVIVAHDSVTRCKRECGGRNSLKIDPNVIGDREPFSVGYVWHGAPFMHILDDFSLNALLNTLDTFSDFVGYLVNKEAAIRAGWVLSASGEMDLLAHYLTTVATTDRGQEQHDLFSYPKPIIAVRGDWAWFRMSAQRKAQVAANEISYVWDKLVEAFNFHALTDSQYFSTNPGIDNQQKGFFWMAQECRTRRRMLAKALTDLMRTNQDSFAARVVETTDPDILPTYVFILFPRPAGASEAQYRKERKALLWGYMLAAKVTVSRSKHIVGVATEPGASASRSEDFGYLDATQWTTMQQQHAEEVREKGRMFMSVRRMASTEHDFPVDGPRPIMMTAHNIGRNAPCPCGTRNPDGTRRKYKKCCGR